jgi:hypothetical protein
MKQQREQQCKRESPAFSQACFSDELSTRMDAANCVRECDRGQPELVLLCRLSETSASKKSGPAWIRARDQGIMSWID